MWVWHADCSTLDTMKALALLALAVTSLALGAGCTADTTDDDVSADDVNRLENAKFECETTDPFLGGKKHKVTFAAKGLNSQSASRPLSWIYLSPDAAENDTPIQAVPATSPLSALNENYQAKVGSTALVLKGDSDGFFFPELSLTRKSGYKAGYAKVTDAGEGFGDLYSKVSCKVTPLDINGNPLPSRDAAQRGATPSALVKTPLSTELGRIQKGLQATAQEGGECSVKVRAFVAPPATASASDAATLVLNGMTYKRYRQVEGSLTQAKLDDKVREWVSSATDAQLSELAAALTQFGGSTPQNQNIWLRSDDVPNASSEWAEHAIVYFFAESKKVVTVTMKCVM